jgi:hypothetical protein
MKPESSERENSESDIREEYDFSRGTRGRYAGRYATGTNLVILAPDVAAVFPDSQSVNEALRTLVRLGQHNPGLPSR